MAYENAHMYLNLVMQHILLIVRYQFHVIILSLPLNVACREIQAKLVLLVAAIGVLRAHVQSHVRSPSN